MVDFTPPPPAPKPIYSTVINHALESTDPISVMLRGAADCLDRDEPDIHGAKVFLHGARLGHSYTEVNRQDG